MNPLGCAPARHVLASSLSVLAISASLALAAPAAAASLEVFRRELPPEVSVAGASFDVDETTGRVRLDIDFIDASFDSSVFTEEVAVPGLVFDRARREVRYERAGASVACAEQRKVLWATAYRETGGCRISISNQPAKVDAGFHLVPVTTSTVRLEIAHPARVAAMGD